MALTGPDAIKIWLDPKGQIYESLVRFSCGKQPKQVLFTPDGKELWVAILGGGKTGLEAYDPITGKQLAAIKLGGHEGTELTMTGDGKTIFVSQMATSTIWEVDRATRKVVRHYKSGGTYTKILLLSRDEKLLYASNWKSNDVSEIDVATGKVLRVIPVVTTPRGLYITPDSKYLYVSGFGRGELQKIELATGKGKVIYKTGGSFRHMAADEQKNLLYVGEFEENKIYVVDMATDEVRKLAGTDQRPNTIELSPDGKVLYVSNRGKDNPKTGYLTKGPEWGTVLAIDTATGKLLDAIVGGNQCTGLDVSPGRQPAGLLRLPRLRHPRLPHPRLRHVARRRRGPRRHLPHGHSQGLNGYLLPARHAAGRCHGRPTQGGPVMGNPIVHWELIVSDLDKAREFYTNVFQWQVEGLPAFPGYPMVDPGKEPHGAMMVKPESAPGFAFNVYFGVDSVEAGSGPGDRRRRLPVGAGDAYRGMGEWGMFADPDGIPIGLFHAK